MEVLRMLMCEMWVALMRMIYLLVPMGRVLTSLSLLRPLLGVNVMLAMLDLTEMYVA